MTEEERIEREALAVWCEQQTECAVVERLTVDELVALGPERAGQALQSREEAIENMTAHPLTHCWVPQDWWLFLAELCEKRLQNPGEVLEMLISGGIRSGKSFVAAMLEECHRLYTERASVFCLSRTEDTSQKLQQKPIEYFMPPEVLGGDKGAIKQTKHEKAKFSGGKFTDNKLVRFMEVEDEDGRKYTGGGELEFRMFKQEVETYRGYALTFVWSDEAVPLAHVKALFDRLVSRAIETRMPAHIKRMRKLLPLLRALAAGVPGAARPHPALLGALMHGVHLITYTPEEGFTATVRYFLQGAVKPDEFKVIAPELQGKPGVKDPRVPKIAYGAVRTRLTGYLHTAQNRIVNSYPTLSRSYWDADEVTIRIKLYGDAEAAETSLFSKFGDRHLFDWKEAPRDGTLYFFSDQAFAKPWTMTLFLVDASQRIWQLMRWPSPNWLIRTNEGDEVNPGAWAVPTMNDKLNGDKGPAAKLRLEYPLRSYIWTVYLMLQRALKKFAETGDAWRGSKLLTELRWEDAPELALSGEFAWPEAFVGDKRWLGNPTQRGQVRMSLHEALLLEENFLEWEIHEGNSQRDGVIQIQNALSKQIGGLPALLINRECKDTIFALGTYNVPEGKDAPPENDQACKEDIDMLRMMMMWGAVHYEPEDYECRGGGSL